MKVLLVDDNALIRRLYSSMLKKAKVNFILAESAMEALSIFEEDDSISLVITDINMPQMNGIELAKEIKQKNPLIPLYANTGSMDEHSKNDITEFFDDIFMKPQDTHTIIEMLKKHVSL